VLSPVLIILTPLISPPGHISPFATNTTFHAAVVVGADRVARNGDVANKIGTYQIALLAKHHGVPFYVAAPVTCHDDVTESGDAIIIEERPPNELTTVGGVRVAAEGWFELNGGQCDV